MKRYGKGQNLDLEVRVGCRTGVRGQVYVRKMREGQIAYTGEGVP